MKRILIENAEIVYDGGPLQMEDVYFVNCTFTFAHQRNDELLAESLLSPDAKTTFSGS
ncbi:MAG: hypothetical protein ACRD27_03830 [Terracidiphilus sp.]